VRCAPDLVQGAVVAAIERAGGAVRGDAGRAAGGVDVAGALSGGLRRRRDERDADHGERSGCAGDEGQSTEAPQRGSEHSINSKIRDARWKAQTGNPARGDRPGRASGTSVERVGRYRYRAMLTLTNSAVRRRAARRLVFGRADRLLE